MLLRKGVYKEFAKRIIMNIKNLKIFNRFNISITLISVCIIILMMFLSRHCCFWGDDSYYAVYSKFHEGIFDCLFGKTRLEHGGYYIGLFLCKFFSFGLPALISIHPADFNCIGHGIIKGIFTVICLLILSKFAIINTKSQQIRFFIFLFLSCYFFSNAINSNVIIINYNFYRYFFSLIFYGLFWIYIYKGFIKGFISKPIDFKLYFYGFIIGTSSEIIFFSSALLITMIFIYNSCSKIKPDKPFLSAFAGLFSGIFLFTSSPGFLSVSSDRGLSDIKITLNELNEFIQLYFQVCFKDEYIYWIIFITTAAISVYFAIKNKEIKKIVFPFLMQISILTVLFSLVLCGKTYDEFTRDRFFLCHWNIVFLYKMLILYPLFIFLDYTIKNLLKITMKNYRKYLRFAMIFFIFLAALTYFCKFIDFLPHCNSNTFIVNKKRRGLHRRTTS